MIEVVWDDKFKRIFKKWAKKHPDLIDEFKFKLELFCNDPFDPSLKTHSLRGELSGLYSARINFQYRLVFGFTNSGRNSIILINIGTHEEVY